MGSAKRKPEPGGGISRHHEAVEAGGASSGGGVSRAAGTRRAREIMRLQVDIRGAVQGVGFRPFVYRLAASLSLAGWVANDTQGVIAEVEGARAALESFLDRLRSEKPQRAVILSLDAAWLPPAGYRGFEIRESNRAGAKSVVVLPDLATCDDCLRELFDPGDRRYGYPFTNCTNCGPRFSIIEALPYDRPNTTMRRFAMCRDCLREYEGPEDRRFHAQPNACPACGPRLSLWTPRGEVIAEGGEAVRAAAAAVRGGSSLALKGIGGFLLVADARSEEACALVRQRKERPRKPFAVMARTLAQVEALASVSHEAAALLCSPECPIVLLPRLADAPVAEAVAPGSPTLGVMLPYAPLHHLLLAEVGGAVVATSGNLSDEPICIDEREALARLGQVADLFLVHDRPIARHVDDSVAWIVGGVPRLLRRARGYAPLPVGVARELPPILGVGAHMKSAIALSVGTSVFVSQHIGDLETPQAMEAFERVIADFLRLYEAEPSAIGHDLHRDYLSTKWAVEAAAARGVPAIAVQHHHAHLAACLAENGVEERALGVIWDGTGYGSDGTVWGGEFLLGDAGGFARVASLSPFRLPGGEAAVREPARIALALLWELFGEEALAREDLAIVRAIAPEARRVLARMLSSGLNAPVTTSAGRLFDGVSALLGICERSTFEGEAAMALEWAASGGGEGGVRDAYPFEVADPRAASGVPGNRDWATANAAGASPEGVPLVLDWRPLLLALIEDLHKGTEKDILSLRFHTTLVKAIAEIARRVGAANVALSGGCFQNRLLLEGAARRLADGGHRVIQHRQLPPNDGCIGVGQVAVAAARPA